MKTINAKILYITRTGHSYYGNPHHCLILQDINGNIYEARTQQERNAHENACDCLYYGYGRKHWNSCGLSEKEAARIWQEAREQLANE